MPFYIYFFVHFTLFFFFPTFFTHFGLQKNTEYIVGSVLLYGGINASWLPLLFLELTLLTPLFFVLQKKHLVWLYLVGTLLVLTAGTIWFVPYFWYRGTMWIGWSVLFLLGLFSKNFKHTKKIFSSVIVGGGVLFLYLFFLWSSLHHSRNFTDNKYPPNLYYLSYATSLTSGAFLLSQKIIAFIPSWTYEYVSKKSYSLFFIHYIVLDFFLGTQVVHNIAILLLLVICVSVGISLLLDRIEMLFSNKSYWRNCVTK